MPVGPTARELLANRNVSLLLTTELLVSGATTALTTTLGWQGYQRTHDPLTLGLIGLAEFLPAVLLAIPAGQLADRIDRRIVVTLGLAVTGATAVALALDAASGDGKAWPLYRSRWCSAPPSRSCSHRSIPCWRPRCRRSPCRASSR